MSEAYQHLKDSLAEHSGVSDNQATAIARVLLPFDRATPTPSRKFYKRIMKERGAFMARTQGFTGDDLFNGAVEALDKYRKIANDHGETWYSQVFGTIGRFQS